MGKFKGTGDHPKDDVQFEIDVQELRESRPRMTRRPTSKGEWHIWAKCLATKDEAAFTDPFHVTEPVKVQVQKRALRVLLFAGSATREYQFLRTILFREMTESAWRCRSTTNRLSVNLNVDQDVRPSALLDDFPNKLGPNDPNKQFMSLNDYDVIVAFDRIGPGCRNRS